MIEEFTARKTSLKKYLRNFLKDTKRMPKSILRNAKKKKKRSFRRGAVVNESD